MKKLKAILIKMALNKLIKMLNDFDDKHKREIAKAINNKINIPLIDEKKEEQLFYNLIDALHLITKQYL